MLAASSPEVYFRRSKMKDGTTIYGYSRGYRFLSLFSVFAIVIVGILLTRSPGIDPVAVSGLVGFSVLFFYSWSRASRRVAVIKIEENGLDILDPAIPLGIVRYEEIEEVRIYATLAQPTVAFRLHDPEQVRRRGPMLLRGFLFLLWLIHHYQIAIQLDHLDDQVAAIKSVAARHGIPVRSELI